jgi:hypothetical protein
VGRRVHWSGGRTGRGPRLALRHPLHERPPQLPIPKPGKSPPPGYKSPAISAGTDECFELNDSANWTWFCSAPLACINIPVLGDAELIIGLTASGEAKDGVARIPSDHMASIDVRPVREMVEEILEGGKAAFEMRRLKYGF